MSTPPLISATHPHSRGPQQQYLPFYLQIFAFLATNRKKSSRGYLNYFMRNYVVGLLSTLNVYLSQILDISCIQIYYNTFDQSDCSIFAVLDPNLWFWWYIRHSAVAELKRACSSSFHFSHLYCSYMGPPLQ